MPALGDDDAPGSDEAAGGGTGGLHETLPILPRLFASDGFRGFGWTDGFIAAAFGEQSENGSLECGIGGSGRVAAAGV